MPSHHAWTSQRTAGPPSLIGPGPNNELVTADLAWLHHSNIGYVPLPTSRMAARGGTAAPRYTIRAGLENRTGSWENITQGDASPITKPVQEEYNKSECAQREDRNYFVDLSTRTMHPHGS